MIGVSAATIALLEGPKYVVRPTVIVLPHSLLLGPPAEDMSSRVSSIVVNASMDNVVMTATVTFSMGEGIDSLSPFYYASAHRQGWPVLSPRPGGGQPLTAHPGASQPLLAPGAEIFIAFNIGTEAARGEDVTVFDGRVDRVNASSRDNTVTVECRDMGAWWLNTSVKQTVMYGDGSTEAAVIFGQIMADASNGDLDNINTGIIRAGGMDDYVIYPQPVGPESVLEAIRRIAQQAGRDVRWFASVSDLLYYQPDRNIFNPNLNIGPRRYEAITELSWGDEDVRNIWEVYWQDSESNTLGPVTVEDANSIAQYGPRFARVYLTRAENIRTEAEATNFVAAALADSKDPFASHEISMPLEPRVELNDFHRYLANNREYDIDMEFAVAAFRHEWTAGQQGRPGTVRTTIGARGQPIAAYRDYRRSVPPPCIVSTQNLPEADLWAPENTLYLLVEDLA